MTELEKHKKLIRQFRRQRNLIKEIYGKIPDYYLIHNSNPNITPLLFSSKFTKSEGYKMSIFGGVLVYSGNIQQEEIIGLIN